MAVSAFGVFVAMTGASIAAELGTIGDKAVKVFVRSDDLSEKHALRIERMHHGNVKVSSIDADFVQGADYATLASAAATFKGLIGEGAFIGSNSALVAPVSIGAGAIVGAGSVIHRDVAANALGVSRAEQKGLAGWAIRFRERQAAKKGQ